MKWYISTFYQVRNMPYDMLPLSTAKYDPKWFHKGRDNRYWYLDNRKIVNGLRLEVLNMPEGCKSIEEYKEYLKSLNLKSIIEIEEDWIKFMFKQCNSICLLVYEAENNPNSERGPLKEMFSSWGIELEEFRG